MAKRGVLHHIRAMSDTQTDTYPFSLDVQPVGESGSMFQWSIRKHGKLHQRSDRKHPTEAKARSHGEAEIERLIRDRGR
jgi:hypothetical protein